MKFVIMIVLAVASVGCMRPYQEKIYETIENNETAFVIPLEGETKNQAKFDSAQHLETLKVASKRIEIPTRWHQKGRLWFSGSWIPTVRVIKVSRTPVARRWTGDEKTGTSKTRQLLSAESKDSIGVSSGWAITAHIKEEDTARFLYRYPHGNLESVIDNQVFNDCQAIYSAIAAKYEVKDLRLHKDEINTAIRDQIIPMYAEDGITIKGNMGLIDGLLYDDPKIQQAINDVFIAQTLEAKREADRVAQIKQNELDLSIEKNEAEKRKVKADAEAYEITSKAKAIAEGGAQYLELLRLEVDKARIAKWDGTVPKVQAGSGGSTVVPIVTPLQ